MVPRLSILGAALALLAILPQAPVRAETFTCGESDTIQQAPDFGRFYPVRSGLENQDLIWRDVEFMWDSLYAGGVTLDVRNTLRSLARSLVDSTGHNPFGAPYSDIRLTYDYFRREGLPYNTTDASDSSMIFGSLSLRGGPLTPDNYKPTDRSHADCYIFNTSRNLRFGGIYPSAFYTDDEDVTSDRAVGDVKGANSLMVKGPPASRKIDVAGTGWTHPDSGFFVGFNHEFQHGLPPAQVPGSVFSTEMLSAGAEAIGGFADTSGVVAEVPYTWSLLGEGPPGNPPSSPCGFPSGTCVRSMDTNYQGRTMFGAYLAYNFRGSDTTATLSALADDLLWKWAKVLGTPGNQSRRIAHLRDLLGDVDCGTCAGKTYFHPADTALDNPSRMALLHHNWRVAKA